MSSNRFFVPLYSCYLWVFTHRSIQPASCLMADIARSRQHGTITCVCTLHGEYQLSGTANQRFWYYWIPRFITTIPRKLTEAATLLTCTLEFRPEHSLSGLGHFSFMISFSPLGRIQDSYFNYSICASFHILWNSLFTNRPMIGLWATYSIVKWAIKIRSNSIAIYVRLSQIIPDVNIVFPPLLNSYAKPFS
jgi:hypothetical protein